MSDTPAIESKSIDWIPLEERRGKPSTLFPLWFMSNANLTTLATGMVGAALGASLLTSLLAIVSGVAVGTVFTAFHSAQGPQLGLPQMIQSRAQFGYRGVVVICAVVVFSIVGFNVFNQILAADVLVLDHRHRSPRRVVRGHHRACPGAGHLRVPLDPPVPDLVDLDLPGHLRSVHHGRARSGRRSPTDR